MTPNKIIAFVPTRDRERAKKFFVHSLGMRFVSEDDFALVLDADGTMVRVTKVSEFKPQPFTILGWEVKDVERTMADLTAKGLRFERYGLDGQDARGIWQSPSGARIAWFKDPDGNVMSLTQFP